MTAGDIKYRLAAILSADVVIIEEQADVQHAI